MPQDILDQLAPLQTQAMPGKKRPAMVDPLDALAPVIPAGVDPLDYLAPRTPPGRLARVAGQVMSPVKPVQRAAGKLANVIEGVERPIAETEPTDIRDFVPTGPVDLGIKAVRLAAELTGLPSIFRAGKEIHELGKASSTWGLREPGKPGQMASSGQEHRSALRGIAAGITEGIGSVTPLDLITFVLGGRKVAKGSKAAAQPAAMVTREFRTLTPTKELSEAAAQAARDTAAQLRSQVGVGEPRLVKKKAVRQGEPADVRSAEASAAALAKTEAELPPNKAAAASEAAGFDEASRARRAELNRIAADNLERTARAVGVPEEVIRASKGAGAADLVRRSEELAAKVAPPKAAPAKVDPQAAQAAVAEVLSPRPPAKPAPLPPLRGKKGPVVESEALADKVTQVITDNPPQPGETIIDYQKRTKVPFNVARREVEKIGGGGKPATISAVKADLFGYGVGARVNTLHGPGIVRRIFRNKGGQETLEIKPSKGRWDRPEPKNPKLGLTDADYNRSVFGMIGDFAVTEKVFGPSAIEKNIRDLPPEMVEKLKHGTKAKPPTGPPAPKVGVTPPKGPESGFARTGIPLAIAGTAAGAAAGDTPGERLTFGAAGGLAALGIGRALQGRGAPRQAGAKGGVGRQVPEPPAIRPEPVGGAPITSENIGPPPRGIDPQHWQAIHAIEKEAGQLMERGILDPRAIQELRRFWGAEEAARRLGLSGRAGAEEIRRITGDAAHRQPMTKVMADLDARYQYLIDDPRGFMRTEAVLGAAGALTGAAVGATIEGESVEDTFAYALSGALLGAGLGIGLGKGLSRIATKKSAATAARVMETADTANLLFGPAMIKASLGSISGTASMVYQRLREGRFAEARAGLRYLSGPAQKEYWRTLTGPTSNLRSTNAYATAIPQSIPEKLATQFLRPFIAADRAGTEAGVRMGFSKEEAKRMMLAGEPTSWQGQALQGLINSNFLFRMLVKFPGVRIGSLERAFEYTPGLHKISTRVPKTGKPKPSMFGVEMPKGFTPFMRKAQKTAEDLSPRGRSARAEFGGALMLAGGAYGYFRDPDLAEMGLVSSVAGPAFLPVAAAMAGGKALTNKGISPAVQEMLATVAQSVPQIGEADVRRLRQRVQIGRPFRKLIGAEE